MFAPLCLDCATKPAQTLGRCRRCYLRNWRRNKALQQTPPIPATCRLCKRAPARSFRSLYCSECHPKRRTLTGRLFAPGAAQGSRQYSDGYRAQEQRRRYDRNRSQRSAKSHWRNVQSKYGINEQEYDAILRSQGNKCPVCESPPTAFSRRLCVDHKHDARLAEKHGQRATVRGVICWRDNYWILRRGVTPEMLRRAADYLEKWPARAVLHGLEGVPTDGKDC